MNAIQRMVNLGILLLLATWLGLLPTEVLAQPVALAAKAFETHYDFDDAGRLIAAYMPDGTILCYEYGRDARPLAITAKQYAPDGQLVPLDTPEGRTEFNYDKNGNCIMVRNATGRTEYFFDEINRLTKASYEYPALTKSVIYEYDPWGRLNKLTVLSQANVEEMRIIYKRDLLGRFEHVNVDGIDIAYDYAPDGKKVTRTVLNDIKSQYTYDPTGHLSQVEHCVGQNKFAAFDYSYDPNGLLLRSNATIDNKPRQTNYSYSNLGALTDIKGPDGRSIHYTYDATGMLTSVKGLTGENRIQTDSRGLPAQIGDAKIAFDLCGRISSVQMPDQQCALKYSPLSRVTEVASPGSTTKYDYSADGRLIGATMGNERVTAIPDPFSPTGNPLVIRQNERLVLSPVPDMTLVMAKPQVEVRLGDGLGQGHMRAQTDLATLNATAPIVGGTTSLRNWKVEPLIVPSLNLTAPSIAQMKMDTTIIAPPRDMLAYSLERAAMGDRFSQNVSKIIDLGANLPMPSASAIRAHNDYWSSGKYWQEDLYYRNLDADLHAGLLSVFGPAHNVRESMISNSQASSLISNSVNPFTVPWFDIRGDLQIIRQFVDSRIQENFRLMDTNPESPLRVQGGWAANSLWQFGMEALDWGAGRWKRVQDAGTAWGTFSSVPGTINLDKAVWQTALAFYENMDFGSTSLTPRIAQAFKLETLAVKGLSWSGALDSIITVGKIREVNEAIMAVNFVRKFEPLFPLAAEAGKAWGSLPSPEHKASAQEQPNINQLSSAIHPDDMLKKDKFYWNKYPSFFPPDDGGGGGGAVASGLGALGNLGEEFQPKGVKFDKPAEFYGQIGAIRGVSFDPKTKRVALLGDGNPSLPPVRMDDFVVALQVAFGDHPGEPEDPTFTLDPEDPKNPAGDWLSPIHMPEMLAGTHMGDVMLRADWVLKQYTFGVIADYDGKIIDKRLSSVPGYRSYMELLKAKPGAWGGGQVYNRFWILPLQMRLERDGDTLIFTRATMQVQTRRMEMADGRLADSQDKSDPIAEQFAAFLTEHYDEFAREAPVLEEVREAAKVVAIVKWLKKQRIGVNEFKIDWKTVPADKSNVLKRIHSLSMSECVSLWGMGQTVVRMVGGVELAPAVEVVPASAADSLSAVFAPAFYGDTATSVAQVTSRVGTETRSYRTAVLPLTTSSIEFMQKHPVTVHEGVTYAADEKLRVRDAFDQNGNAATYDYDSNDRLIGVHVRTPSNWELHGALNKDAGRDLCLRTANGDDLLYSFDRNSAPTEVRFNDRPVARMAWTQNGDTVEVKHLKLSEEWPIGSLEGPKKVERVASTETLERKDDELRYTRKSPDASGPREENLVCRFSKDKLTIEGTRLPPVVLQRKDDTTFVEEGPGGKAEYQFDKENGRLRRITRDNGDSVALPSGEKAADGSSVLLRAQRGGATAEVTVTEDRLTVQDLSGARTTYEFDGGRLKSIVSTSGKTQYEYAAGGDRLTTVRFPGGRAALRFDLRQSVSGKRLTTWLETAPSN
jgi:YD repeat-containing protein